MNFTFRTVALAGVARTRASPTKAAKAIPFLIGGAYASGLGVSIAWRLRIGESEREGRDGLQPRPRSRQGRGRLREGVTVYAIVDLRSSSTHPLGQAVETFVRREDAARFIEEVRSDEPEMAAKLRIEERELDAGDVN